MKPRSLFLALLVLVLASCALDTSRVAGGVDANPNCLVGRIELGKSRIPAPSVTVILERPAGARILAAAGSSWIALDTTCTDSTGSYLFPLKNDGAYRLVLQVGDSVLQTRIFEHRAASGSRIDGTLSLPEVEAGTLLIDDFEPAATTVDFSRWFRDALPLNLLYNDSTRIALLPVRLRTAPDSGIMDCGSQGRCFHLSTSLVAADAQWDLTEFYHMFRPTPTACFDFSRADTLTLLARGTGTLRLSWWGKDAALTRTSWSMPSHAVPLASGWTRIAIPTDSIRFDWGTDTLAWKDACVHKLTFGLQGAGELWIDDIRLHGASLLDLQTR